MGFKNFRLNVSIRAVGLVVTIFAMVYLIESSGYFATIGFVAGLVVYQVIALINLMENTNRELVDFFSSIRYGDFSHTYKLKGRGGAFDELDQEFNKVLYRFKQIRAEKEAEYQYLKNIIHHIGIGILSFERNGNVQIINTAAKRLFKINRLQNIQELESFSPELIDTFKQLRTGAKALIRVRKNGELVQLAVYAIELYLKGEEFKLVTIQNIHSELEEQEMDAWQNLIRVLTHEIMNSVTPISSLATTVEGELSYLISNQEHQQEFQKDDLEDLQLAVQTIQRRSDGLIRFVNEFRNLTHVPTPKMAHVKVAEMFERIKLLMNNEFLKHEIDFVIKMDPPSLIITADPELIEQVLINLLKNAIQAFHEHEQTNGQVHRVTLSAMQGKKNRPVISVKDNGPGIEKEALDRIFIPFYTTKKNGSGIGLSLSRQIMRQHKGTITACSNEQEGTEFLLNF
ncbi:ATP-binding protein [Rapidithrix thailandica]|uniref:histidine kinase n=1 Tax=Rapidithrix thailandica TaxID=413964 RepID=A0AAW9S168_9BACT